MRISRNLLQRVFDTLEALWDCAASDCRADSPCERCATLDELRKVLDKG